MRVFFSVGEPSGDLHGANLVRSLQQKGFQCEGFGGPRMQEAGFQLLEDLTQYAVMFLNALIYIPRLWRLYKLADRQFATGDYQAVVLIDFPGFNWWIAKAAKRHGVPVFYYGVPQMWAWLPGRVKKLKRLVDHTLCKLPFEEKWFRDRGCEATYVGHPYFDELHHRQMDQDFLQEYDAPDRPLLTLLPGSRTQEVQGNLEWLVTAAWKLRQQHPGLAIAVAAFNHRQAEYVRDYLEPLDLPIDVFVKRTPELIELSTLCLACSGSVSLELMFHTKPSIIVYRLKPWQAVVKPLLIRCRFITLVNLLATDNIERTVDWTYDPTQPDNDVPYPEFPWLKSPVEHVTTLASQWLNDPTELQRREIRLQELKSAYAAAGATERAASYIAHVLQGQTIMDQREPQNPSIAPTDQDVAPAIIPFADSHSPETHLPPVPTETELSEMDGATAAAAAWRRQIALAETRQPVSNSGQHPFAGQQTPQPQVPGRRVA